MRVDTESCIQLRLIDVNISQLAIKVSARVWIGVEGLLLPGVEETDKFEFILCSLDSLL